MGVTYLGHGVNFPVANAGDIRDSGATFPVLGFILLLLRAAAYRHANHKPGLADLFSWIAWLCLLAMGVVFLWSESHGFLGYPNPPVDSSKSAILLKTFMKNFLRDEYFFLIFMVLALGTTKLSILFFFRQMFAVKHRRFWDIVTRILIALVSLWTLAYFFANTLNCGSHVAANWQPQNYNKYCLSLVVSTTQVDNSMGISDAILDAACVALPFPLLWHSNLSLKFKISITACFLFGLATIAISVARTVAWIQVDDAPYGVGLDAALLVAISLQWAMIEAGIAFIASQLPALGIYVTKLTTDRRARANNAMPSNRVLISLQALPSKTGNESDAEDDGESSRVEGRASTQAETEA